MKFSTTLLHLGCILATVRLDVLAQSARTCSTPSTISDFNNSALPNPFLFNDGSPVQTAEDWACRRAQISAFILGYEAGFLPPKPEKLTGSFSQSGTTGNLTFTATNGDTSISFSSPITFPNGTAPTGGWPLIIGYEGGSIPIPAGVSASLFVTQCMYITDIFEDRCPQLCQLGHGSTNRLD